MLEAPPTPSATRVTRAEDPSAENSRVKTVNDAVLGQRNAFTYLEMLRMSLPALGRGAQFVDVCRDLDGSESVSS